MYEFFLMCACIPTIYMMRQKKNIKIYICVHIIHEFINKITLSFHFEIIIYIMYE